MTTHIAIRSGTGDTASFRMRLAPLAAGMVLCVGLQIVAPFGAPTAAGEAGTTATAAGKRPPFQLPFPCGQKVRMESFAHAPALDMFRVPQSATEGNTLVAPADGVVNQSYNNPKGAGNIVQINHGGGWFTTSIHLQSRAVKVGDRVKQGQRIGKVGHTGQTSGGTPHLHFEQAFDRNGDGKAEWGEPNPERVAQVFDGKTYGKRNEETSRVTSRNCSGSSGGRLSYKGPKHIANGTQAKLSAVLSDGRGGRVANRSVTFALGSGSTQQKCRGTTNAEGMARCTVKLVKQPLTKSATVPLAAKFAGDRTHPPASASAKLKLQYFTGRAFGLRVGSRTLPLDFPAEPDTGQVRTAAKTTAGRCAQGIPVDVLTAGVLCAKVSTKLNPGAATTTSSVVEASLTLPDGPVIKISGLTAKATSSCRAAKGTTSLTLTVDGETTEVPTEPNTSVDLPGDGRLIVNEQQRVKGADHGIRVIGVHMTHPDVGDIVLASATSALHNCAPR
jgi:hypothetical protein